MDKNQAIIEYLMTCPIVQSSNLFFNFAKEEADNTQFIKIADVKKKQYIDGSELKNYTFNLICYKSISHNAIAKEVDGTSVSLLVDENMEDIAEVQSIIDWINEQSEAHIYPDFGNKCIIDSVWCVTDDPDLFDIDTSVEPPLAKYSIVIKIEYIDNTKMIFTR